MVRSPEASSQYIETINTTDSHSLTRNISSNFFNEINSIPNERGFKMIQYLIILRLFVLKSLSPKSQPFVVVTAYRPPNSLSEFFVELENLIKKIDDENKGIHILADLYCDLLKTNPDLLTKKLKSIFELYKMSQLIDEPTRITSTTSTLIDHFITNRPEKISDSGVIHTGISDHSMIFGIREINFFC